MASLNAHVKPSVLMVLMFTMTISSTMSLQENILNLYRDPHGIYLIDGIDVYYDNIINDHYYAECIGELIKSLKKDKLIKLASISPSYYVLPQYRNLYQNYVENIRWVNYQFYYQKVEDRAEFKKLYHKLASEVVFFQGCQDLFRSKFLAGISVWDADSSAIQLHPFHVEKRVQEIIVNPDSYFF